MNNSGAERADVQHPWIGLASFTEGDRSFFAGRGDEIDDLLRLVRRDTLTLLYGVSGLGKTSLVQAGLFPALREENFLPVPIRLDYLEGALSLSHQVINAITAAAMAARVEAPRPRPDETLWEYFHREGNHFWSARNDLVTPFLAFDQFEELFTLGRETPARTAAATAFIIELADLVEDRPPGALRDDPSRAKGFNFKPAPLKVLLAMREDYLADLDRIRSHFRALGQNRLRLLPMGERQARQVIALGAPLLAPGVEDRIAKYVAGAAPDAAEMTVAPALLSLVLRELNERRLARGPEAKITSDLLDVEQHKIFEDFYLRTLADFPAGVRLFIEDELLTASGHRDNCALDDALTRSDVTLPILNELVNRRLLAYEDRHNTRRVELTHDVLVPVIKASRDSRLTHEALAQAERLRAEQVAQRRRHRLTLAVACALALTLVATIWGAYYLFVQEHQAYYSEVSKRNGFPIGVTKVSESQARRLAVSFLLVHKGITREGWKVRWKPAFRMVAVDSRLKPTTNHTVGTYLWKKGSAAEDEGGDQSQKRAEGLGLHTVCQWEFDSNAQGEIIYERALDRDGRMIFGFIYSPRSGSADTRLARFVGPEGFPQLQRRSEAEYVSIHYNRDGFEDRVTYRDGKNLPAAGPEGAFGQRKSYNSRGQLTLLLSIDADEKNMIDNMGNCGMQVTYNDKGWVTEEHSLGPDLQPMPIKDGWTVLKAQSDDLGRCRRATYYDLKNEPVLLRYGYHAWEAEFDEHGNQIALTYIGLDGKPTLLSEGVAMQRSICNAEGKITRMSYHGVQGEPVLHKDGCQAWEVQYDERGNEIVRSYIGLDGNPTLMPDGMASQRSVYNAEGKLTQVSYYGVNGEPVLHKEGYHAWQVRDDKRGNKTVTTYLGPDGKPVVIPVGYASFEKTYDSDGNGLELAYFDAAGNPTVELKSLVHKVFNTYDGRGKITRKRFSGINGEAVLHKEGFHGWDAEYDNRGNQSMVTYVDLEEKPILIQEGYAIRKSIYNAQGKTTQMTYHGVNGEPVLFKEGYHGWEAQYDKPGNMTMITYVGLDRKPSLRPEGYAITKSIYNERGKATRTSYYGENNEPVSLKGLYHAWTAQYDERGNEIEEAYFDLAGKPILQKESRAHKLLISYDSRGNEIRRRYYGVKNEPVLRRDGNHGWDAQYDGRGYQVEMTFVDRDEKPILLSDKYATIKTDYDASGREIRMRLYGVKGERVQHKEGHHGRDTKYDERGRKIETSYFGLDEKPFLFPEGYSAVRLSYDARDRVIRQTYHGTKGERVLSGGFHGWQLEYDERGNGKSTTYFGLDQKPTLVYNGFAISRATFDARGNAIRRTYHGVNGEPVMHREGYHGWEAKYDERGKEIAKVYFGVDGKPISLKQDKKSDAR